MLVAVHTILSNSYV